MNWTLVIRQRTRVAVLLAAVMGLVIITVLVERKNINDISQSVASIYNDRLVPASDIFDLTEQFYNKRFLMEKYLITDDQDASVLRSDLSRHDQEISTLLAKYERSFLVSDESKGLEEMKSKIALYQQHENSVIDLAHNSSKNAASLYYSTNAKPVLQATLMHLSQLSDVQTEVGSELLKKSAGIAAMSRLLLSIQVVLSVVIGMMIVALVNTSKIVSRDSTNYHLN